MNCMNCEKFTTNSSSDGGGATTVKYKKNKMEDFPMTTKCFNKEI